MSLRTDMLQDLEHHLKRIHDIATQLTDRDDEPEIAADPSYFMYDGVRREVLVHRVKRGRFGDPIIIGTELTRDGETSNKLKSYCVEKMYAVED